MSPQCHRPGRTCGPLALCAATVVSSAVGVAWAQPPADTTDVPPAATPASEDEPPLPVAGYDKGFFIQSPEGDFRLKLTGRVQFRHTYEGYEDETDRTFFSIPRARIKLTGHAFTPDLTYNIHTDFGMGGTPTLKDGYADYGIVPGKLHVRAGQYKKPFSRQTLSSGVKLNLVERAITEGAFGTGRDLGLMVHDDYASSPPFEYAVGVFNGTGDKGAVDLTTGNRSNVPDRFDPVFVARVGYNHGAIKGYDEADFDGGPPRFSLTGGPQIWSNFADEQRGAIELNAELLAKAHGLTAQAGVFAGWEQAGPGFGDQEYDRLGLYVEVGHLIGKLVQPSARWARVMPTGS
ncbi:MAG: hypothetical protein JRI68_33905, partial [Deltaproteobacteria bacterium]|nr:hypothetical protein [Deltaproteobacteria bacterium]